MKHIAEILMLIGENIVENLAMDVFGKVLTLNDTHRNTDIKQKKTIDGCWKVNRKRNRT